MAYIQEGKVSYLVPEFSPSIDEAKIYHQPKSDEEYYVGHVAPCNYDWCTILFHEFATKYGEYFS